MKNVNFSTKIRKVYFRIKGMRYASVSAYWAPIFEFMSDTCHKMRFHHGMKSSLYSLTWSFINLHYHMIYLMHLIFHVDISHTWNNFNKPFVVKNWIEHQFCFQNLCQIPWAKYELPWSNCQIFRQVVDKQMKYIIETLSFTWYTISNARLLFDKGSEMDY